MTADVPVNMTDRVIEASGGLLNLVEAKRVIQAVVPHVKIKPVTPPSTPSGISRSVNASRPPWDVLQAQEARAAAVIAVASTMSPAVWGELAFAAADELTQYILTGERPA